MDVAALAARLPGVVDTSRTSGIFPKQLFSEAWQKREMTVGPPHDQDQVASFLIAEIAHPRSERVQQIGPRREDAAGKVADTHDAALLRARRQRPRDRRAAQQRDELRRLIAISADGRECSTKARPASSAHLN